MKFVSGSSNLVAAGFQRVLLIMANHTVIGVYFRITSRMCNFPISVFSVIKDLPIGSNTVEYMLIKLETNIAKKRYWLITLHFVFLLRAPIHYYSILWE